MKAYIWQASLSIAVGFILGLYTANRISSDIKSSTTVKKSNVEQSSTSLDNQKINGNVQKDVWKISYFPNGKVKEKIEAHTSKKLDEFKKDGWANAVDSKEMQSNSLYEKKSYLSNLQIGFMIDPMNPADYSKFTPVVSYRIVGGLYGTVQTDIAFTRPMIGMMYQF